MLLYHISPDIHINVRVEFGEGEGKIPIDKVAEKAGEYKPSERITYKMIQVHRK